MMKSCVERLSKVVRGANYGHDRLLSAAVAKHRQYCIAEILARSQFELEGRKWMHNKPDRYLVNNINSPAFLSPKPFPITLYVASSV